ncbi:MAG: group II truncated hemoglobin [Thermoleophilia bacterium]
MEGHLQGFRTSPGFRGFHEAVAPFVGDIQEMSHHERVDRPAPPDDSSIYAHAGGADAFRRLTHLFYAKVVTDPLLEPLFRGMAADHPERVALWLGEVFGGPPAYTRTRGGYPTMVLAHINRDIGEEQRRRWIELLLGTLDEAGLPADARFRRTFREYIEWGTGVALRNSRPGFTPPREAHVPLWPWSTTPPD